MISGITEMALRVFIIVVFSGTIGFTATAYAETGAWFGAMLLNMIALHVHLRKKCPARSGQRNNLHFHKMIKEH